MNDSPVCPAIMMFGGSPMSVAVPPMFAATTSMITSGSASISSSSAIRNVTGTMSRIVVRLSRNAESSAVAVVSSATSASGRPCASCAARIATNVNTPVVSVSRTAIIIPASRPSVSNSIASSAPCWSIDPSTTTSAAPANATLVRSTRSDAISPSAQANTPVARSTIATLWTGGAGRNGWPHP